MATQKEIEEAQDQLNKMPLDGIIITNERTAFKAIGAEGKAIDVSPYLQYYERRVFTALNTSEAMMGRGSSRQNADSMEGLQHDTVKYFQKMISIFIENCVFNEILLEGGFNPIFTPDDWVSFEFNEINLDTKVKMENHELVKFQDNAITFEEMRRAIGKGTEGVDESRLYTNMITTPSEIEVLDAKVSASCTTGNGNLKNGKTTAAKSNGEAKNVNAPRNQHGTSSAKIGESVNPINLTEKDVATVLRKENNVNTYRKDFSQMYKKYVALRNEVNESGNFSKRSITKYTEDLQEAIRPNLEEAVAQGYVKSQLSDRLVDIGDIEIDIREVTKPVDKAIARFITDLAERTKSAKDINSCFEFMEYRLRFICAYYARKAYWYGVVKGYAVQGVKTLHLDLTDTHKDRKSTINTDNFDIDQIPPFAPYCKCGIKDPNDRGEKNEPVI